MFLADAAEIAGVRTTRDGYLVAQCRVARSGCQTYLGSEVGRPERTVVLYRPEDEVFDQAAIATFAHRPVTISHPTELVTADTWKAAAVGMTGAEVMRDKEFISVPLILLDRAAIDAVQRGTKQLSAGYTTDISWESGEAPDGQKYQGVMRSLRANHIALVDVARAGSECRVGTADAAPSIPSSNLPSTQGARAVPDENLRVVVVDGLSISVTNQGAEAIALLQRRLSDAAAATEAANTRISDAEAAHRAAREGLAGQIAALRQQMTQAVEAKDGEIAGLRTAHDAALVAKDTEITALRSQISDEAVEARVAARSGLVAQAKPFLGDGFNPMGMSDAAIRKAVVVKAMGANLTDADSKGDAFFDAAFTTVVALAPKAPARAADPLRTAIAAGPVVDAAPQMTPWQANVQRLQDAWKTPSKEAV